MSKKGRIFFISMFIASFILVFPMTACGCDRSEDIPENINATGKNADMKLYINDVEIPVFWENNDTTAELAEQAESEDIVVLMSMYSDNEQVGSLGRSYTRNDKETTTQNGDIVLYNGNNIVVFYGSNSWSYTRLGKMDLSEREVIELLSNGDVELKISLK